jgi:hypothetical protein
MTAYQFTPAEADLLQVQGSIYLPPQASVIGESRRRLGAWMFLATERAHEACRVLRANDLYGGPIAAVVQ